MATTETILIVEDDEDIRESLAELLAVHGDKVVAVGDGRAALGQLESGLIPCLILLDLMMPEMSGWEFRKRQLAEDKWSGIPIVVLSGIANAEHEAHRLQAIAFIPKPINIQTLHKVVDQYC
jgi:two-component system response regulator MprA